MGLKMRDWVWDDNRQAGSKAALTRGQNRCLILNLLIWAIFHSVSKNDKNEIEKVLRRSKGWLWSCSARGGKRGAGEDGQIYFPRIYSSYLFLILPHIYYSYFSSYFLMWGAGEDGQIYISSLCSSANTNWDHNFDKESSWSWINNPLDGVDGQLCKAGYIFPLTSADTKWDKKLSRSWSLIKWSFDAILHIYVPIPIMIENHSHGSVWWSGAGIIWVIVVVAYI